MYRNMMIPKISLLALFFTFSCKQNVVNSQRGGSELASLTVNKPEVPGVSFGVAKLFVVPNRAADPAIRFPVQFENGEMFESKDGAICSPIEDQSCRDFQEFASSLPAASGNQIISKKFPTNVPYLTWLVYFDTDGKVAYSSFLCRDNVIDELTRRPVNRGTMVTLSATNIGQNTVSLKVCNVPIPNNPAPVPVATPPQSTVTAPTDSEADIIVSSQVVDQNDGAFITQAKRSSLNNTGTVEFNMTVKGTEALTVLKEADCLKPDNGISQAALVIRLGNSDYGGAIAAATDFRSNGGGTLKFELLTEPIAINGSDMISNLTTVFGTSNSLTVANIDVKVTRATCLRRSCASGNNRCTVNDGP